MRKSCCVLLLGIILCPVVIFARAETADVSGDWELAVQGKEGSIIWSVKFNQEGEKLSVTMVGPKGNEFKGEGTIKGNEIQWSITRKSSQGNQITRTYKGKVEGSTMSGQADTGGQATADWTAKKK